MDTPIQVDLGRIAQDLQIRRVQVESVVQLLDEGNTVPFITRYRKERTGNLNEVVIREVQARVARLRELAERKETILKSIEAQGKLTDELRQAIRAADNSKRLEDLYLPYKPKKKTKASEARERGLEPLAVRIWNRDETLIDLEGAARDFLNPEKEIDSTDKVLEGVGHILAESISELAEIRDAARRVVWKTGKIATSKAENVAEAKGLDFRDYFNYSEPIHHIPPHRVLAINRGDKEGTLKIKLELSRQDVERAVLGQLPLEGHPQSDFFTKAALDALDRLLLPSLEREVRRDLTEMAERHAVEVFARNLRSLLLQPPIPKQTVLAIDPGVRSGCKIAVLDPNGNLLDHGVIYPHPPQNRRHEAKLALKDLIGKHQVGVVAIGSGTACRETEELVAEIIAEGTRFHAQAQGLSLPEDSPPSTDSVESTENPDVDSVPSLAAAESSAATPDANEPATPDSLNAGLESLAQRETHPTEDASPIPEQSPDDEVEPSKTENGTVSADAGSLEIEMPPIAGGSPDEEAPEGSNPQSSAEVVEPAVAGADPVADDSPSRESESSPENSAGSEPVAQAEPIQEEAEPRQESAPTVETDEPALSVSTPEESPSSSVSGGEGSESAEPKAEDAATVSPLTSLPKPALVSLTERPKGKPEQSQRNPRPPRPKTPPPPPAPHPADEQISRLAYVIVNEAGASVYSASPVGREEFPELDATLRGTISIGRRLQDPLSELVKIEPQNIGVGLYQHDVNPKYLKESLETVIESCVNFVGVDLNSAGVPLLRHVSGLNQLTARRIVEHRKEKGPFVRREQLLEVEGIGPVGFTQAAGFLKIVDGENPFDRTWVHPESYEVASRLLERLGFTPDAIRDKEKLAELRGKLSEIDVAEAATELGVGRETLQDIRDALERPDRDPRDDLPKPIFKTGILKLEDLSAGMELKGTVLNVVDFGAFIDIGLKDSGLAHISQLANKYVKSPHDVVSVGDVVTVWVLNVDHERKRVSLTMVKPGTERPRTERGEGQGRSDRGGRRGPGGEGQEQGRGERRGPARRTDDSSAGSPTGQGQGPSGGDRASGSGRGPVGSYSGGGRSGGGPGQSSAPRQGGGRGPSSSFSNAPANRSRLERAQAPRQAVRSSKPAPPPPPLSKEALSGSVPLRTFGQLKQLWQAREDEPLEQGVEPTPPADEKAENHTGHDESAAPTREGPPAESSL